MGNSKHIIDAYETAGRLRNVLTRMRLKAVRSSAPEHREDLGDVFDEEQAIAERQLEKLLSLAAGEAATA